MGSRPVPDASHIRTGQVFWVSSLPVLSGGIPKDRFVVVLSPSEKLTRSTTHVLVVAVSSSTTAADRIELPNKEKHPWCTSGLLTICWAVPGWWHLLPPDALTDCRGYLLKLKVDEIARATRVHIQAGI